MHQGGTVGEKNSGKRAGFYLEVFVSPGGYICGEESALIEAIEGHRAEPRNKPPFPGAMGLWQKPTVINNVETFANVPQILMRGVEWYKNAGADGSRGLKFVGVSGHVKQPGVFEVPMGTPMSEVIFGHAGGIRSEDVPESICAFGAVFGIFASVDGGCAAGFQGAGGCGIDVGQRARLWFATTQPACWIWR